jgi:hypothetical protein
MIPGTSSPPPSPTAETPLIPREAVEAEGRTLAMGFVSPSKNDGRNNEPSSPNNNDEHGGLQFYDPAAILDVSRELAFGYLILLTGGAVEYAAPAAAAGNSSSSAQQQQQRRRGSKSSTGQRGGSPAADDRYDAASPAPDKESASLAYAAIVDGNVLHACFGLKASANGRVPIPAIGGGGGEGGVRPTPSIFCCFPAPSGALDALQLVLPHLSGNKVRMANLVEMLREVRDLHHEEASRGDVAAAYAAAGATDAANAGAKVPLQVRITRAYVRCFTAVVGYHDAREIVRKKDAVVTGDGARRTRGCIDVRCRRCFAKPKIDPKLETLRKDALEEISTGFRGLREDIWQSLENTATESAITTGMSSVEGSTSSVERGGKR